MKSSIRLGGHETTVLTNRSRHITIVSDQPFKDRSSTDFGNAFTSRGRYVRGSRPMHRSTFCFEDKPFKAEYVTTTHKAHTGKHGAPRSTPPHKCQSLHHSHFSIGITEELDLKTQTMKSFDKKRLIPASKLHEDRGRWNDHVVAGHLMDKSLRHVGFEKVTHETTYGNVHDLLGRQIPRGLPRIRQQSEKFNIISGAQIGNDEPKNYRLCSGNKTLQKIRNESSDGILG